MPKKHLVILLNNLEGGGMQRITLRLIHAFQEQLNLKITLVLSQEKGEYQAKIPEKITVVNLGLKYEFRFGYLIQLLPKLTQLLKQLKPDIILSSLPCFNFLTVLSHWLSGNQSYLVLSEHTLPFHRLLAIEQHNLDKQSLPGILPKLTLTLMKWTYPKADSVIAVSHGIAVELQQTLHLSNQTLSVIHNPVVNEKIITQAQVDITHPWFQNSEIPVFLAVGRLARQKDYPTLLKALAQLRQQRPVRLLVLGEGESRKQLENLIQELELSTDVDLLGFVDNPFAYLRYAQALVLTSVWEILPTVLIEALACGCPVISTNCDYGPDEILDHGRYGWLVPIQDITALAEAMNSAIDSDPSLEEKLNRDLLRQRASDFSVEKSIQKYLSLLRLASA